MRQMSESDQDRFFDEIEFLVSKGEEYYPGTSVNIGEAMQEASIQVCDLIGKAYDEKDATECGEVVFKWLDAYWRNQAEFSAEKRMM